MKRLLFQSKFFILSSLIIVVVVSVFLYMFNSHDVGRLKDEYPHIIISKQDDPDFELKSSKPKTWVKLPEISKYGKWAIIFSEDWAFYDHEGVDVEQVKVAFNEMVEGDRVRGASTITQQMVKNVYLSNSRTLWRKLHEYILTYQVEKILPKQRILEIYLNVIEFGPGIYGIKSAANHYFKKHPSGLTPRASAFLAMLLPSPKRYYQSFKNKRLTKFAQIRIKAILKKLRMGKIISPEEYEYEINSYFSWEPQPVVAPVSEPQDISIPEDTLPEEDISPAPEPEI